MTAPHLRSLLLLRTARLSTARPIQLRVLHAAHIRVAAPVIISLVRSFKSQSDLNGSETEKKHKPKYYDFKSMEMFSKNPTSERVLVDAREPEELQNTGTIPGSINIPVTSQPDAFFIPEEEFENRFGFARPSQEQELVFYCRSGVRSATAAQFARSAGWEHVNEYKGSWIDWERNTRLIKQRGS